jgi:uncharacterized membrane protein YidH (DUF202 family)
METTNNNKVKKTSGEDDTQLALLRTKFANERTYMAYLRTGLAISAISLPFKKYYIVLLGIIMIICSTIQYYYVSYRLNHGIYFDLGVFELVPVITTILILGLFYLEMRYIKFSTSFKFSKLK